jgi:hypothetical protein
LTKRGFCNGSFILFLTIIIFVFKALIEGNSTNIKCFIYVVESSDIYNEGEAHSGT